MLKKLFIIPGHGASDPGATRNGYQEAERVRALATKIKEYGGDNVILSDFDLNSYRSNIIGKGLVPKDCIILELHLDSSTNATAKGGHVIINANFKADEYDEALAKMISETFPGRANTIVGRTNIANVRRAAEMGYNYRLLECCFISNEEDIKKFNSSLDKLAKEILACFKISIDPPKTYVDIKAERLIKGSKGDAVMALQILLVGKGYGTFTPDGSFGALTEKAVRDFQSKNGTGVDGICGVKTWNKLLGN